MFKYLQLDFVWLGNKVRCIKPTYYGGNAFGEDVLELIALLQVDGWVVFVDAPNGPYVLGNRKLFTEFDEQIGMINVNYPTAEHISV